MRHYVWNMSLAVGLLSSIAPASGMVDLDVSGGAAAPAPVAPSSTVPGVPGAPAQGAPGAGQQLVWKDQADALKEVGVTTLNESRGNWFFKNKIGKDARKVNDKISKKVANIMPLQEKYLAERGVIDASLTSFYREYGVKAGEIDEHLNTVLEDLKKLEETKSPLDDQEKVLLAEAKKKKEEIVSLKNDFDVLQKLEDALSKSLVTMSAQITKANAYSDQAWEFYEKIEDTLSDEAAEDLLNRIHVLFDNVTAIEVYLTGEFRSFFTTTSQKIMQQIESIKQRSMTLKNQGVILGQKMRDLKAEEAKLQQAQADQSCSIKSQEDALKKRTWLSPIFDVITWVWVTIRDSVAYVFNSVTGLFTSKKAPQKSEAVAIPEQKPSAEEVPVEQVSTELQPVSVAAELPEAPAAPEVTGMLEAPVVPGTSVVPAPVVSQEKPSESVQPQAGVNQPSAPRTVPSVKLPANLAPKQSVSQAPAPMVSGASMVPGVPAPRM